MASITIITAGSLLKGKKTPLENEENEKTKIDIEVIRKKLISGDFKLDLIKKISWRDFEIFCADILKINGFKCINNLRFKCTNKKRYEIDILAVSELKKIMLSIDAKHWKIGGLSKIVDAITNQVRRTNNLIKNCEKIFSHKLNLEKYINYKKIPLIITLDKEQIKIQNGIPVVPLEKLNSFIQNFDGYTDLMLHF